MSRSPSRRAVGPALIHEPRPTTRRGWGSAGGLALIHEPRPTPAPALVLVAHGSRDPRHAATVDAIAEATRAARPDLPVHVGFLDHNAPDVTSAVAAASGDGGDPVVAVPLLLGHAYHGRVDVPAALEAASAHTGAEVLLAEVLGPDPALLRAAHGQVLGAAGIEPGAEDGVVLACAGTTDAQAKAELARLALRWGQELGAQVRVADAARTGAGVADTVRALQAAGCARVDVAAWFLAPGLLLDRVARQAFAAGADSVAAPLGAAPEVIDTVLRRYAAVERPMSTHVA